MAKFERNTASIQKVLMVHNFYQIGGGEHTVFENEVNLLKDHGHEVIEYTRSNDELKKSRFKLILSPLSTIWSFKTYREVKNTIIDQKIDIVHCHNTFPLISPAVYYAARSCGVPVLQTIHNFRFLCPNGTFFCDGKICEKCREKNSFKDAIKNRCYRGSKIQTSIVVSMLKFHRAIGTYNKINYIFLTEFNKDKFSGLIDVNGKNVFIKPNFVKEEREENRDVREKIFVFAGRLEENKGIKILVDRWKKLPSEYILFIYGDGTLKDYIEEVCKENCNINFLGFKPQKEIFKKLQSAVALVFPSIWYEGFPMTIAESFSIGCPVIATNIGNQASIIRESKAGCLFELDSKESFTEAIHKVITNREEYSEMAKKYYEMNLTPSGNYKRLIEIYERAE